MRPKLPLYYQVEEKLRRKIERGDFDPGDPLPSEQELVELFKVSRLTIREAINRLVAQGLVVKIQGKGTFVAEPKIKHRVGFLFSNGEEILARNFEIETKVLKMEKIIGDKEICKKLDVSDGDELFYLERLRFANKKPATYIKSYIPYKYVGGIEFIDFTKNFLYRTLEDHFNLSLYEAEELIEAVKVDEPIANMLGILSGSAILLVKRITYLEDGCKIEYDEVLYRSDIFQYHVKLIGRSQGRMV